MAERIKGIIVRIGGDTTGLSKALSGTNKQISETQKQLKDVERLLKLDPKNTELLEQRQRLLSQAVGETKGKLDSLKDAQKQVQEQFDRGEITKEQYEGLQREIASTELQLKNLEKAAQNSGSALLKISDAADKVASGANKVADKTKKLSAVAGGAIVATAGLSIAFEDNFAKVKTLLDKSKTDMDAYKQSIIDASNESGVAVDEYSESVYSSISASIDQADAVEFTKNAVKLAKGGFTDTAKSVDVLTTAINGYGLSAKDTEKLSDLLITTQNQGKTTVDELAASVGKVIPIASSANFSFQELSAAYALMTKNGVATAESGTYLKGMLNELTKAGSQTDTALKELTGKGFTELKKSGKSTSEILNMLSGYAEKNGKSLKDMFGSVEAGSAALMLSRKSGKEFDAMLSEMQKSAGATQAAFDDVSNTTGQKFKKSLNELKNTGIELGDTLSPIITIIMEKVKDVISWLSSLDESQIKMIGTVLMVVAAISPMAKIIGGISSAISGVTKALQFLMANPMVAIIAAIVGLVLLIATKGDEIQAVLQKVDDFLQNIFAKDWAEIFGPVLGGALNGLFDTIQGIWNGIKRTFDGIIDFIRGVFTGDWERAWNGVKDIFGGIWDTLVEIVKAPINAIIWLINCAIDGINWIIDGINCISFDVPDWLGGGHVGFDIGSIDQIPYLAQGGVLSQGSAVVGEAGPELLTVTGNRAIVEPLTQNTNTTNVGGNTIYVYGAPGQDVNELADILMDRMGTVYQMKGAVWAK